MGCNWVLLLLGNLGTLNAVLHLALPEVNGGECTYASHLLEATAYEGRASQDLAVRKWGMNIIRVLSVLTSRRQLSGWRCLFISVSGQTPKAPIAALLHPVVMGATGGQIYHMSDTKQRCFPTLFSPVCSAFSCACSSAAPAFAAAQMKVLRVAEHYSSCFLLLLSNRLGHLMTWGLDLSFENM